MAQDERKPSKRQIVFNWMMDEPDFATKVDGYWGGTEEVRRVDALLAALAGTIPAQDERLRERFTVEGACGGEYAIVWDRKQQRIVLPSIRTGALLSDDAVRTVASDLNELLAEQALSAAPDWKARAERLADEVIRLRVKRPAAAPAPPAGPLTEEQVRKACKLAKVRLDWDDVRELRYFLNCTVASDALVSWTQHASHVKPVAGCHLCKNTLEGEAAVCHICGKEYGNAEELKAHNADLHQLELNQMLNLAAGKGEAASPAEQPGAPSDAELLRRATEPPEGLEFLALGPAPAPAGEEPTPEEAECLRANPELTFEEVRGIRQGLADVAVGRTKPLEQIDAELAGEEPSEALREQAHRVVKLILDLPSEYDALPVWRAEIDRVAVEFAAAVRQAKLALRKQITLLPRSVQNDELVVLLENVLELLPSDGERPAEGEREGGRT